MKIKRLVSIETSAGSSDLDVYQIDDQRVVSSQTRSELNMVYRQHRDFMFTRLVGGGAGFWVDEVKEDNRANMLSRALMFNAPDPVFIHSIAELKPVDLLSALEIAQLFNWKTDLKEAVFETEREINGEVSAESYYVYTEEKLIEVLKQMEGL